MLTAGLAQITLICTFCRPAGQKSVIATAIVCAARPPPIPITTALDYWCGGSPVLPKGFTLSLFAYPSTVVAGAESDEFLQNKVSANIADAEDAQLNSHSVDYVYRVHFEFITHFVFITLFEFIVFFEFVIR